MRLRRRRDIKSGSCQLHDPNTMPAIPSSFIDALELADPSWRPVLRSGLEAVAQADPTYLPDLAQDRYLPTGGRIFAAFAQPLDAVRYVLIGEGPYPRVESATGFCFMDGAVGRLWSESGLSREVNRATSLRNFMKMLLVADGKLSVDNTGGKALAHIAAEAGASHSPYIEKLADLQHNMLVQGFLLLNAALTFRPHVPPIKESKAWQPLMETVLGALAARSAEKKSMPPILILWGKMAEKLTAMPAAAAFPFVLSEHPYNLSFIRNGDMQNLFSPLRLLYKPKQGDGTRQPS